MSNHCVVLVRLKMIAVYLCSFKLEVFEVYREVKFWHLGGYAWELNWTFLNSLHGCNWRFLENI